MKYSHLFTVLFAVKIASNMPRILLTQQKNLGLLHTIIVVRNAQIANLTYKSYRFMERVPSFPAVETL